MIAAKHLGILACTAMSIAKWVKAENEKILRMSPIPSHEQPYRLDTMGTLVEKRLMLMKIRRPILVTAALLGLSACAKNSSSFCECDQEPLPVPEKIVRSRMGFIPEQVEVSIDLTKAQVNYSRSSRINADDSCE